MQSLQDTLVNYKRRQKIQKLFISGENKTNFFKEKGIFGKPVEDYILIYFVHFTLILFYKRRRLPGRILKYENVQFETISNSQSWKNFVIGYLIGQLKLELNVDFNSRGQVEQMLEKSKTSHQKKQKLKKKQDQQIQTASINQINNAEQVKQVLKTSQNRQQEQIKRPQLNQISDQIDQINQNTSDNEIILENSGLDEMSEIKIELELQKTQLESQKIEYLKKEEEYVNLKRNFSQLEQLKDEEVYELNCKYNKQANQFQDLQNQILEQHKNFNEFKQRVENEIAEYKKRSTDKKQIIEEQKDIIKEEEISKINIMQQSEQKLAEELNKKSIEKRKLIGKKEEEIKTCEKELNFRDEVIKFFVVCFPESKNQIREKLFNFGNNDVKTEYFSNVEKMQQFINQQYRSKSPTPIKNIKTPVQTPIKNYSNPFK